MNRNCMSQTMPAGNSRMMYDRQNTCNARMPENRTRENYMTDHRMCDNTMCNRMMQDNRMQEDIPTGSRQQLLRYINEVSFAVYEALLYLDTHPNDQEAMQFFREHNHKRNHALKVYADLYGPLVIATADDCASQCWEWMNQPWPWEGGDC